MNVKQIKELYSMRDIIYKCKLRIHLGGFCTCPFHKNDDTPSLKLYDKSFYCFACGKGGDFIKFVEEYKGLSFKDACKWISGEDLSRSTKKQLAIAEIKRQKIENERLAREAELTSANQALTGLWNKYLNSEPLSDEWTEAYNKWQIAVYRQENAASLLEGLNEN
jgi:DNA primase